MNGIRGVATDGPDCTCGTTNQLHAITCMVTAAGHPHAMVNNDGDVFYPDNADEAAHLAEFHKARPVNPERWPYGPVPGGA